MMGLVARILGLAIVPFAFAWCVVWILVLVVLECGAWVLLGKRGFDAVTEWPDIEMYWFNLAKRLFAYGD